MRAVKLDKDQFKKQLGIQLKSMIFILKNYTETLMVCFSPKQGNDVSRVAAWQDKVEGFQCETEESVNNSP